MIDRDLRRLVARIAADRGCGVDDLSVEVLAACEDFGLSVVQRATERVSERPTVAPGPWEDDEVTPTRLYPR